MNQLPDPGLDKKIRARQQGRAIVMALALFAFVILLFAITITRMGMGTHK